MIERRVPVPVRDAVTLYADRYWPSTPGPHPTVLMRTPYGRTSFAFLGRLFAQRGIGMLIQSCRGRDDSGGQADLFRQEEADGIDTVRWIRQQPWFDGRLGLHGASYMGHAAWAIAAHIPDLGALAVQVTAPDMRRPIYPGGALALDVFLRFAVGTGSGDMSVRKAVQIHRSLPRAWNHLPLRDADVIAGGRRAHFWQDLLDHPDQQDPWWIAQAHWSKVGMVTAPTHLLGGWFDFFLPDVVEAYRVLRAAGHSPHLIIGPWAHSSWQLSRSDTREALSWFQRHLLNQSGSDQALVRVYLTGARRWLDLPDWPPPTAQPRRLYLQPHGRLGTVVSASGDPDTYRFDPVEPTPVRGGTGTVSNVGPRRQNALEARQDVLTYTSQPLSAPLDVLGDVSAAIYLQADPPQTDLYICLCDVDRRGRSVNVSAGWLRLTRATPGVANAGSPQQIRLWPVGHRFAAGHRIRLQVAGGAHPRIARNHGTGEDNADSIRLNTVTSRLFHDLTHPSHLTLAVQPSQGV